MPFPIGASQRDTLYRYFAVHLLWGQPGYKDRYPKNLKKALYEKQPICEFIRTAKLFEKSELKCQTLIRVRKTILKLKEVVSSNSLSMTFADGKQNDIRTNSVIISFWTAYKGSRSDGCRQTCRVLHVAEFVQLCLSLVEFDNAISFRIRCVLQCHRRHGLWNLRQQILKGY